MVFLGVSREEIWRRMRIKGLSLLLAVVSASLAHGYQIQFEGIGRGKTVDYVFRGARQSNFAGELTFSDLRTNLLFKTMCADLDDLMQTGEAYDVIAKHSVSMDDGVRRGGTVYAQNYALANTNDRAAALQIAVWAARYGTDLVNNKGGDFQLDEVWVANNTSTFAQALLYFNAAKGPDADAIYLEPSTGGTGPAQYTPVPEPATLVAVAVGLSVAARKRKR